MDVGLFVCIVLVLLLRVTTVGRSLVDSSSFLFTAERWLVVHVSHGL